ncbi:MAG: cyclophilin-like fold protein [Ruminococcus sp.]|jgi:hypothetical protein
MKKQLIGIVGLLLTLSIAMTGCSGSSNEATSAGNNGASSSGAGDWFSAEEDNIPSSNAAELAVQFGDGGDSFVMHLEDNSTAAAIAGYVGTADWRLPVYSYDESDVMEYYDIPSRYEIPDNSETVTEAHAGDVFYSDPNRIVLYYHDAKINEQYTRIGTFDATEEFVDAVENNPVLEGWGNQIVVISDGE